MKAVYIYSNGDTLERSWVNRDQRQRPVSIVATNECGSVREFSNHYQVFLRIEKHNPDAPLARQFHFHCSSLLSVFCWYFVCGMPEICMLLQGKSAQTGGGGGKFIMQIIHHKGLMRMGI